MSLDSDKEQLRRKVLLACRAIDPGQAELSAKRLAVVVARCPEFQTAERVGLYAATGSEISTGPVFEAARRAGKRCLFPRCRGENQLEFAEVSDWQQLERGRFGILEPGPQLPASPLCENDLVLVPGVAFDLRGGRMGRGAGYYDRAFAALRPPSPYLMGIAHPIQLLDSVPLGAHDRRMDAVATERGILRGFASAT